MSLFTSNPETIKNGETALRMISLGFIVSSVTVASSGALEGLGKGLPSLIVSLFRYIIIIIPAAFILCRIFGPVGVWNAFWITEIITAAVSFAAFKRSVKTVKAH